MNTAKAWILLVMATAICCVPSRAQVSIGVVILHRDIGVRIDRSEQEKYGLFTRISGFRDALRFVIAEDGYAAILSLDDRGPLPRTAPLCPPSQSRTT